MTRLIGNTRAARESRRALLLQERQVESALETAQALDRVADRIRNARVAEVLHERAEVRRQTAQWARAHLGGRVPCPDPAVGAAVRIAQA
jgi:hypothetical protein